jgi:hypothetical protein
VRWAGAAGLAALLAGCGGGSTGATPTSAPPPPSSAAAATPVPVTGWSVTASGDRELVVHVAQVPGCDTPRATAEETPQAVRVRVVLQPTGEQICPDVVRPADVRVPLARPLGDRSIQQVG